MSEGHIPQKVNSLSSEQLSLEFEHICPRWASKLRIGLDEHDVDTLAHDSKYCIVGEAWGHSGRHTGYYIAPLIPLIGCWKCVKFGREMGKIAKRHGRSCTSSLKPVLNDFVEHWNHKHMEITKKILRPYT
ncbi:MAG TPA: hypothetical protein VJR67_00670 [Candidatus Nitrosopolaris sp.]|nr:hypothetical protein [Candidatus Nitrosopolaris sp.]